MEVNNDSILRRAKRVWMMAQFQADTELFLGVAIDEVAILFRDMKELNAFVQWAELKGMKHFNSVEDNCLSRIREPHSYRVHLSFLSFPDLPWRLEVMCVLSGDAPLHRIHLERYGIGPVHASWKCKDLPTYTDTKTRIEGQSIAGVGLVPMVEYQNAYGLYAYYGGPEADRYYFKPRVNLRDQ